MPHCRINRACLAGLRRRAVPCVALRCVAVPDAVSRYVANTRRSTILLYAASRLAIPSRVASSNDDRRLHYTMMMFGVMRFTSAFDDNGVMGAGARGQCAVI